MEGGIKKVFEYGSEINGNGSVTFQWSQDFSYLAVCGENQNVYILDKRGKQLKNISLLQPGKVVGMEWDMDSEFLCIHQENLNFVSLWNVFNQEVCQEMQIDNSKSRVSFIKWSKTHPVLAVGTDKGSLIFYNKKNQKKIPTMGKHAKKIISGDWNKEGFLITGGEDKILTISNYNSDTQFDSVSVKAEPRNICWARQKTDSRENKQRTICSILQQKSILMFELNSNNQPLELVFEQKYGKIIDYELFGDGYIVVGFTEGYVAHISTHMRELKDEVSSERIFNTTLDALCTNDSLYKLAVAGENMIKIYNLSTWNEIKNERIELPKGRGKVKSLKWSQNGQLLVVSTTNGSIIGYLTSVPFLSTEYGNYACVLSSFTEASILNLNSKDLQVVSTIQLEQEPSLLAIGQNYVATGFNNMVWYYDLKTRELIIKKDYFGSIKKILLNEEWSAVQIEGKIVLQQISDEQGNKEKRFPLIPNEKPIRQFGLTQHFLVILDEIGKIKYYHLSDETFILEFKPDDILITQIFPNFLGTKMICIDKSGNGYLFLSATEELIPIINFQPDVQNVLWDKSDPSLFITIFNEELITYSIKQNSLNGTEVIPIRELLSINDLQEQSSPVLTILDKGIRPVSISNGYLTYYSQNGNMNSQYLVSHSYLNEWNQNDNQEGHYRFFLQNLMLGRLSYCLMVSTYLNDVSVYEALGREALSNLQLDIALRAFQNANNLSMVLTIQSFKNECEKKILMGNVAMILGKYDLAQELFLKSSNPTLALDMRCDIQDWLIALNLAKMIAPKQEPLICKRLAILIESQGNHHESQRLFEKSFLDPDFDLLDANAIQVHNMVCQAGIARNAIKMGDISRGFNLANDLNDNQLIIDIAIVCENMKQLVEAAQLYEKCGIAEKAASLYIQLKMFKQATPLISKIKSPKLLTQLAKSKESEGNYVEAEKAFDKAEDWENVIRININFLDDIEKATAILRNKCQTVTCATMVGNYCEKKGMKKEAIEFFVMAGKQEEAFVLAQSHNEMETYANSIKEEDFTTEERLKIAQYYEGKSYWGLAAQHYEKGGFFPRALKLYKQAGDEYINTMIEMIGQVKNDNLTESLLDYLMGEDEIGVPKEPIYTYKVYRVLGLFKQAAKIAVTIAGQDQEQGDYKSAHQMLFETFKDMRSNKIKVPYELYQKFLIIHSYVIVKRIVKLNQHQDSARLLNRVCKNITQFPTHAVNILTSVVIEATKANLKYLAYIWATVLVRPEYRQQITEKYKNKIENIARKPVKSEGDDSKSACPFCKELLDDYQLDCQSCQNTIPFCIASGRHIVANECCFCPNCNFPANISYFKSILEVENTCPICQQEIDPSTLQIDQDPIIKLKTFNADQEQQQENQQQTK